MILGADFITFISKAYVHSSCLKYTARQVYKPQHVQMRKAGIG